MFYLHKPLGDNIRQWQMSTQIQVGDKIRLATWNCGGLSFTQREICSELGYDILALTETHDTGSIRPSKTQLLSLLQDLSSNPAQTDMIIMDFSKAFDKVPHRRPQYKLDWYGIRGSTHNWIQHFLQGISQRVVSEGSQSSPMLSSLVCPKVLFLARYYF